MPYHIDCVSVFPKKEKLVQEVNLKKRLPSRRTKTYGRRILAKHVGLMNTAAKYGNKDIQDKNICKTHGLNEHGCKIREQRHTGEEHLQNTWT
jgi:hypothetical protein